MTPTLELIDYLRVIMFPLCALGFIVSAISEYQNGKSKLRLVTMLVTALAMLVWMVISLITIYNPSLTEDFRHYAITPVIVLLTVLIWSYAVARTDLTRRHKYNGEKKGGCLDGEIQQT